MKNQTNNEGLKNRLIMIQQGTDDINAFILEYIPFIKSSIFKITGIHVDQKSDEMSIGLLAFNEAINHYDNKKGSFLTFAYWVIKRRMIDYMRKQNKSFKAVNFSDLTDSQQSKVDAYLVEDADLADNPLKLEIDALTSALKKYGINFEELVMVSPKAKKTKDACIRIVNYILDNPKVSSKMQSQKRLPVKNIQQNLKIPQKLIDRHRKYIICVVEILSGEYIYLKEYVAVYRKGENIYESRSY